MDETTYKILMGTSAFIVAMLASNYNDTAGMRIRKVTEGP